MEEHEMTIGIIRAHRDGDQRVVGLRNASDTVYLGIWIGRNEADAIISSLRRSHFDRPMTHDLLLNTITAMGGEVLRVVVSKLESETFHAKIEIKMPGGTVEVDSRASDAIALSVRASVPIFVAGAVLDEVGVGKEGRDDSTEGVPEDLFNFEKPGPVGKKEREQLTAFASFIESLDIADLGEKSDNDPDTGKENK